MKPVAQQGSTLIAGKRAFSLKGYQELATLVRVIASAKNMTIPEVLDKFALKNLRRATASLTHELGGEGG